MVVEKYGGAFKKIVFAVLNDASGPRNFEVFRDEMQQMSSSRKIRFPPGSKA